MSDLIKISQKQIDNFDQLTSEVVQVANCVVILEAQSTECEGIKKLLKDAEALLDAKHYQLTSLFDITED